MIVIGQSGVEVEIPDEYAHSLIEEGVVRLPGDEPAESTPDGGDQAEVELPPAEDAPKAEWVRYATRVHGARFGDASRLTKDELIARYGQPADADESEEDQP